MEQFRLGFSDVLQVFQQLSVAHSAGSSHLLLSLLDVRRFAFDHLEVGLQADLARTSHLLLDDFKTFSRGFRIKHELLEEFAHLWQHLKCKLIVHLRVPLDEERDSISHLQADRPVI